MSVPNHEAFPEHDRVFFGFFFHFLIECNVTVLGHITHTELLWTWFISRRYFLCFF